MDAMDMLQREHELIQEFLGNLSSALERLEQGRSVPRDFFDKAVEFARVFADKYHHFKEEYVLFGKLAEKGGGRFDAEIEALRYQHDRGRNHITEISNSLDGFAKGVETNICTLLENVGAYIHLLNHHIHREDHVFYPMVREALSPSEMAAITELFQTEDRKAGPKAFETNQGLVRHMASLL
ncbi:MAG: hemerythrin domain-containing protein [Thermodesulfobacteriota bacterium]